MDSAEAEAPLPVGGLSKEELARRGDEIYEQNVRPHVNPSDDRKFVAIDVMTGEYEVDASDLVAIDRLRARQPHAAVWLRRVGSRYAYRFGAGYGIRHVSGAA